MTVALGKIAFSDTPNVNGADVLTTDTLSANLTNLVVPGTEGFTMPVGTTAQRPATPQVGETRWNTSLAEPEVYSGTTWYPLVRVVQSVSGTIGNTSGTGTKATATVPLVSEGLQIWTQSFTPMMTGSTITVQYTISAYTATAGRLIYTSVFAGNTCIGTTASWNATAAAATGAGLAQLAMQCIYTSVSTAPITFQARCGNYTTAGTPGQLGINQLSGGGTFGASMVTEYRIVETI